MIYRLLFAVAEKTAEKNGRILSSRHILFSMVRECVSMDEISFLVKLNQALGGRLEYLVKSCYLAVAD